MLCARIRQLCLQPLQLQAATAQACIREGGEGGSGLLIKQGRPRGKLASIAVHGLRTHKCIRNYSRAANSAPVLLLGGEQVSSLLLAPLLKRRHLLRRLLGTAAGRSRILVCRGKTLLEGRALLPGRHDDCLKPSSLLLRALKRTAQALHLELQPGRTLLRSLGTSTLLGSALFGCLHLLRQRLCCLPQLLALLVVLLLQRCPLLPPGHCGCSQVCRQLVGPPLLCCQGLPQASRLCCRLLQLSCCRCPTLLLCCQLLLQLGGGSSMLCLLGFKLVLRRCGALLPGSTICNRRRSRPLKLCHSLAEGCCLALHGCQLGAPLAALLLVPCPLWSQRLLKRCCCSHMLCPLLKVANAVCCFLQCLP